MGVQKHDAVAANMSTIPSHVSQQNVLSQVHIQPSLVASRPPNSSPKLFPRGWAVRQRGKRERDGFESPSRCARTTTSWGRRDGKDKRVTFGGGVSESEREEKGRAGLWEIGKLPNTAQSGIVARQGRRGGGSSRLGLVHAGWEMRLQEMLFDLCRVLSYP
jgi:hypothetical protein